jgi:predicted neuraminidase
LILRIQLATCMVCAGFLAGTLSLNTALAQPSKEHIFEPGSTSFQASHASTVVELKDGELMSAWFGGTAEGNPDVAIWGAKKDSSGWSRPSELAREPGVPCWNPVLFHTKDGRLWLYYKFGPTPATWTAARKSSTDEGKIWSEAEHLPAGLVGPVRAKPLILEDGTIISGSSVETYRSWAVWIERSTDGGNTWTKIGPIVPPTHLEKMGMGDSHSTIPADVPGSNDWKYIEGIIQPSVVSLGGKHLRLYARSTAKTARVTIADSYDYGVTWTQARPLDVPNPNSGIDAVALRDGRVVMIYNNTTSGRTPLNLAVSTDGEHFRLFYTLEHDAGEYSYPALIQTANGDLEMTYTWNRKTIEHVRFPLADVPKQ